VQRVQSWNHRLEDDGEGEASERVLQTMIEGLVTNSLKALGRAFTAEDAVDQLRAELLLEVARAMRRDVRGGSWSRLPTSDRKKLRHAVLFLEQLAESGVAVPVA
jgi:hypothetical protein